MRKSRYSDEQIATALDRNGLARSFNDVVANEVDSYKSTRIAGRTQVATPTARTKERSVCANARLRSKFLRPLWHLWVHSDYLADDYFWKSSTDQRCTVTSASCRSGSKHVHNPERGAPELADRDSSKDEIRASGSPQLAILVSHNFSATAGVSEVDFGQCSGSPQQPPLLGPSQTLDLQQ
jgi:hypothetical protein